MCWLLVTVEDIEQHDPCVCRCCCVCCLLLLPQGANAIEAVWLVVVLTVLLVTARAAFVIPFSLLHNCWSAPAERLTRRDVVIVWWAGLMRGEGSCPGADRACDCVASCCFVCGLSPAERKHTHTSTYCNSRHTPTDIWLFWNPGISFRRMALSAAVAAGVGAVSVVLHTGAVSVALVYYYFDDNPRQMLDKGRATLIVTTLMVRQGGAPLVCVCVSPCHWGASVANEGRVSGQGVSRDQKGCCHTHMAPAPRLGCVLP